MKQQTQTYNDGVVNVYEVKNAAEVGKLPKKNAKFKVGPLRYEERTVGMGRYWTAMQNQVKITKILRMPRINSVSTQDIVVTNDNMQYEIKQVQYPPGVLPASMDLSLEKVVAKYEIS